MKLMLIFKSGYPPKPNINFNCMIRKLLFSQSLWRIPIFALFLSLLFCGCKDGFDDYWNKPNPKGGVLFARIKENPKFSIFAQGLERADLDKYINTGGLYTVFAPTNDAFAKYFTATGYKSINDVPIDQLFQILSFHIVNNMWYYYDLQARFNGPIKQRLYLTRSKKFVNIDVTVPDKIIINGIEVVKELRDIDAENGVIHGINDVLIPLPNLEQLMQSDPELASSTFYKLLQLTADKQYDRFNSYDKDRDGRIDSVFYKIYPLVDAAYMSIEYKQNQNIDSQGGDPVFTTILVPSNSVLDPYLAPVLAKFGGKIENLSPSYAEAVLENYFYSDTTMLSTTIMTRTVQPKSVNGMAMVSTLLKNAGDFVRRDIRASNGVIHIIGSTFADSERQRSAIGLAMKDPELTMFMAAIQKANLMSGYANITKAASYLAPTNQAFIAGNIDIAKLSVNGAVFTAARFSEFVKTHVIPSNRIQSTFTGTIASEGSGQSLVFSNNGLTVTGPMGDVATITYPAVSIGPGSVGYVYKIDKILFLK
jgi:uncharacterized surface protein with fasciclin (FAS1) repeats